MTVSELLLSAFVIIVDGSLQRLDSIFMSCETYGVKLVGNVIFLAAVNCVYKKRPNFIWVKNRFLVFVQRGF